jgi:hypothetical protein
LRGARVRTPRIVSPARTSASEALDERTRFVACWRARNSLIQAVTVKPEDDEEVCNEHPRIYGRICPVYG